MIVSAIDPFQTFRRSFQLPNFGRSFISRQRRSERQGLGQSRRIVENYLTVLGGLKQDEIVGRFEGRDAQICASLFSWINDGSHSSHDDIYVAVDDDAVQGYLSVFREVFERTGHGAHYRMMMRISEDGSEDGGVAEDAVTAPPVPSAPPAQAPQHSAAG